MIIKGTKLRVHSPNVDFICWSCHCKCFSNINRLYGIIFHKTIFYNSEVIQWPTVKRVTNIKVYKSLKINHEVHDRKFILKFLKVFFVLQLNCIFLLLLLSFVKVWLNPTVLILYFLKVKFICLIEHVFWPIFLKVVFSPTTLNCYGSLL